MEKTFGEEDIKGLEAEIDSAVDRLFVEKKAKVAEKPSIKQPISEPSYESLRTSLEENLSQPLAEPVKTSLQENLSKPFAEPPGPLLREDSSKPKPSAEPLLSMKAFEMMETHVLSLEWEITKENIQETIKAVLTLRETVKEKTDIASILNSMAKVLTHMIRNTEHIEPPQIKFLLDSKETIKLLMKKETGSEWNIYKQLFWRGIEARFLCLDGLRETRAQLPSSDGNEVRNMWEQQIEGKLSTLGLSIEKVETILEKMNQDLCRLGQLGRISPEEFVEKKLSRVGITILKTGGKLFGIESEKIFKLFKVSGAFKDKILSQQRIRLKDLEIQMVDLKRIFLIEDDGPMAEVQILTIREDGKYRGLMVDQVLKRFSTEADMSGDYGEYFLGMIRWTYQEKPMEIPILNLRKI